MKTGYKIFIGVNVLYTLLLFTPNILSSTIQDIIGFVTMAALFHAIFIAKTPIKPYVSSGGNGKRYCFYCNREVKHGGIYCNSDCEYGHRRMSPDLFK